MKHLKPISKAELTWFEQSPLDGLTLFLQILAALAPILSAVVALKPSETAS